MKRFLKWAGICLGLAVVCLAAPIVYVEAICTSDAHPEPRSPLIASPEMLRVEANSYLTYPEWHIVYAYEGLAEKLKTTDEHAFGYVSAIRGFWSSYCALNRVAQRRGGADFGTRQTIYVIGTSFTLEMALKALYEETFGRLFAALRGSAKSPQDEIARDSAIEYAAFLHQTPWYKFDFNMAAADLWGAPGNSLRSWERRLALGLEWKAKQVYAGIIDNAVQATGLAQLDIFSVVSGLTAAQLQQIPGIEVVKPLGEGLLIKTPRYAAFDRILDQIAARGGKAIEIAGNDDIMVTVTAPEGRPVPKLEGMQFIAEIQRDGFAETRFILDVRVSQLLAILQVLRAAGQRIEHVYDY